MAEEPSTQLYTLDCDPKGVLNRLTEHLASLKRIEAAAREFDGTFEPDTVRNVAHVALRAALSPTEGDASSGSADRRK